MLRLVLLLVLLLLLVRFAILLARRVVAVVRGPAEAPGASRDAGPVIPLVACRACGVMVPRSRALARAGGAYFCRDCDPR